MRDLHQAKFGHVIGEKPFVPTPKRAVLECDEEAARLYEEQLYWEDYHERNREDHAELRGCSKPEAPLPEFAFSDEDVPF